MARQRRRIPGYLFHKASGQAIVVLNGRMSYLGEHGSEESRQEYDRLISEWLANGRAASNPPPGAVEEEGPPPAAVVEVIAAYIGWAKGHYRGADGTPTGELTNIKVSMRPLQHLYGRTPARDFGPKALKAVRQYLLDKRIERKSKKRKKAKPGKNGQPEQPQAQPEPRRLSRTYINKQIKIIRRMFKWAVGEELVPPSVYQGLQAVKDLQRPTGAARSRRCRSWADCMRGHAPRVHDKRPATGAQPAFA